MTATPVTKTWYSGDWRKKPNAQPPYNGIEIEMTPTYSEEGEFVSASITFTDYTMDKNGVKSELDEVTLVPIWIDIPTSPVKDSPPKSPPAENDKFTIKGKVKLEPNGLQIYLRINLSYGLVHHRHDELGYIFGVDAIEKGSN